MGTLSGRTQLATICVGVLVVLNACSTTSIDPISSTDMAPGSASTVEANDAGDQPSTSTTIVASTSSTSAPDSTTTTTETTTTTTTPDFSPVAVAGLSVDIGAGSGEVIPTWDRGTESDLDYYNVWYSLLPSTGKTLLASVVHDAATLFAPAYDAGSGRTAYVDFPRAQAEGTECYQISAVDLGENEGDRSAEVCLPTLPPGAVSGFTVGIGAGSGEVFITWSRGSGSDLDHYNLWYSEAPGGSKTLLDSVAHNPGSLSSPAYDQGSGVTAYIDFPRELTNDKQCYEISAVDTIGTESIRTAELCLTGL